MAEPARTGGAGFFGFDAGMFFATLTALLGYVLPWFRKQDGYSWSYSGWEYASLSDGGGWTLLTFGWLLLALGAALFARQSVAAAMTGVVGAIGTLVTSLAVVAASFSTIGEQTALNPVAQLPFGLGLPVLALGLGLLLATSIRAIVRGEIAPVGSPATGASTDGGPDTAA